MRKTGVLLLLAAVFSCMAGCGKEAKKKDRSISNEMFQRIASLASGYIAKLEQAPDSLAWSELCRQFEDSLDRINFSYPPDTDLLLTEGQNDTIHSLLMEYVAVRDRRIEEILHPVVEIDSLSVDSLSAESNLPEVSQ